jgi:hypothetical protein
MLSRIAAGACALCLVVPALAGAQPIHDQPVGQVHNAIAPRPIHDPPVGQLHQAIAPRPIHDQPVGQVHDSVVAAGQTVYGDATYDRQNASQLSGSRGDAQVKQYERAIAGDTKGDLPRAITPAPQAKPAYVDRVGSLSYEQLAAAYGTKTPAAPAHATIAADDHGTNGWRLAAVIEAALLAAFAIGAAIVLSGRSRRAPRMGV